MVAHYHGQAWNASEIAGSLGVNYKTAQHYLDILVGSFMIRSLPTWTENVGKRVRKAPKIYLRDSGLFHALQRIPSLSDLQAHPKIGASWEGLALEHVLRVLRAEPGGRFTGARTEGPSWTCSSSAAVGGGASSSSTPTRPARPSPCAWRSTT
jgi:predicted AAA+ superfamily ATPase